MHPKMKNCPIPTTQDPEFEILDPDEIAATEYAEAMKLKVALQKITTMPADSVEPFARFMDIPVSSSMNTKFIKKLLTDKAKSDPSAFIDAFEDRIRPLLEMVAMARKHGIVKYDTETGYSIGRTNLGWTKAEVARNLEEDDVLVARLRAKLNEKGYNPEGEETDDEDGNLTEKED